MAVSGAMQSRLVSPKMKTGKATNRENEFLLSRAHVLKGQKPPAFIMLNAQPEKPETVELCQRLKEDPATADIPLLVALDMNKVT